MELFEVKGDLSRPETFLTSEQISNADMIILAHQTNCYGVMGAGVALALREAYPEIYPQYKRLCSEVERRSSTEIDYLPSIAGRCQLCTTDNPRLIVANLFGQVSHDSTFRQTNYEMIYRALNQLKCALSGVPDNRIVAFPKNMSSALAGGTWEIILQMIKSIFGQTSLSIYIVDYDPTV